MAANCRDCTHFRRLTHGSECSYTGERIVNAVGAACRNYVGPTEDDEVSLCNYCGEEIAYSDEPAWCSAACREADAEYAAGDARADLAAEV